ncbi:hypothetical protein RDV84_22800 [Lysobacter yananisis]|uniref:Uncharacterized protein n=1 Tax=Lysobacter yananisis TaxID=1003114 RepID=A0ABY9P7H2_9GAMM|nr:hypothetical protein [Lysobacter yananisis]WMT02760.1 hypothetical protein RDV84_22800 [Lysobacter yananisis]
MRHAFVLAPTVARIDIGERAFSPTQVQPRELNDYAKGTTMHVPTIELDMATLKLDPNRIERAGGHRHDIGAVGIAVTAIAMLADAGF